MSQGSVSNGNQALRPRDVCQQLGIQPYVLKFWEGEFPQLGRRLGAKRLYGAEELKILSEIQRLVEGERLNLGQAREELARAFPSDEAPEPGPAPPPAAAPPSGGESVLNEAKEKIRRLEEQVAALEVQLAEKDAEVESLRHRHQQAAKAAAEVERERDTMAQRVDRLEAAAGRLESHSRQLEEELEAARADNARLDAALASQREAGADQHRRMLDRLRLAHEEIQALGQALDEVYRALTPSSSE
ncbi:MAG: MerR family transcriptional regulator [Acidobacteriota bacterium]|nr:MerR family transcriptional regulator [Acidobacteriota bacterium]